MYHDFLCECIINGQKNTNMDVFKNIGTPKSSILISCFHYKPSILGAHPYFWKHPYYTMYINACLTIEFPPGLLCI